VGLRRIKVNEINTKGRSGVSDAVLAVVTPIVEAVRAGGSAAVRAYAEQFQEVQMGGQLRYSKEDLERAYRSLPTETQDLLGRVARRVTDFATAQLGTLGEVSVAVPGGVARQRVLPVGSAGCYAPGGRFPLPSSVIMTVVTARAAGVQRVVVASPRPTVVTLGAAYAAGADCLLPFGGAHAIAAMAYGCYETLPCDIIVGPGNSYVTAAKFLVSRDVRIDMLAGPSELVVYASDGADAALVAADLLAQAEHDPEALPILITGDIAVADAVDRELAQQLENLATREVAREALSHGFCVIVSSSEEAVLACDLIAPEHLELCGKEAEAVHSRLSNYGALFIGAGSAEVIGDYGAGPNHVLPTGGTARFRGGLSVFDFQKVTTSLTITDLGAAQSLYADAVALGVAEGLVGHAASARRRMV
jgi:histidinol dehydrogenase